MTINNSAEQLWREIHTLLVKQSGQSDAIRDELGKLREENAEKRERMKQIERAIEDFEDHLREVPQVKSDIDHRLRNVERLSLETAAKIAAYEAEKVALMKKQKEDLEQEQSESRKYRRGLITSLIAIGGTLLAGVGWLIKNLLDWWAGSAGK